MAVSFGCISSYIPLDPQGRLLLEDFKGVVTHADPRQLIACLSHGDCQLSFVVLHVPCKSSQCSIEQLTHWWMETKFIVGFSPCTSDLGSYRCKRPTCVQVD